MDPPWKLHAFRQRLSLEDDVWRELSAICRARQHDGEVALLVASRPDRRGTDAFHVDRALVREIKRQRCLIGVAYE